MPLPPREGWRPGEVQRVVTLDESNRRIPEIKEKPEIPWSNYAVIGVKMYDPGVLDMIRRIKPSACGELETRSADNEYLKQNKLTYDIVKSEWTDAGTFESFQHANALLFSINNTIQPGEYYADTL